MPSHVTKLYFRRPLAKFDWMVLNSPDGAQDALVGYVSKIKAGPHAGNWQSFDKNGHHLGLGVSWTSRRAAAERCLLN